MAVNGDPLKYFFTGVPNRAEVCSLRMQLAAGIPIDPDRISLNALPTVILLAYAARQQQMDVVEDYDRLYQRIRDEFYHNVDAENWPWNPWMTLVSTIEQQVVHGKDTASYNILQPAACNQTEPIWQALQVLINSEPEQLLPELNPNYHTHIKETKPRTKGR